MYQAGKGDLCMADRVGQQLGNYRLIRLLGRGGFADVYLGEHVHLDINAAIKVLHTQLTDEDIALFRSEARTLARLIHPQIVRLLDFGIENNIAFLVMDYAPNGTFRERYPRHTTLPLPSIITYVLQVADALQFAHEERLIHRDIKPENMFLGRRNEVVVGDFGIAVLSKSTRSRNLQDISGTVEYMSPEQLHGKPSRASDQYSLAIVVYEWLTGEVPFREPLSRLLASICWCHLSRRVRKCRRYRLPWSRWCYVPWKKIRSSVSLPYTSLRKH